MGLLESWCVYLYPLCWNTPELGSAYITRQISQLGPMDPRADTSMCFCVTQNVMVVFSFFMGLNRVFSDVPTLSTAFSQGLAFIDHIDHRLNVWDR